MYLYGSGLDRCRPHEYVNAAATPQELTFVAKTSPSDRDSSYTNITIPVTGRPALTCANIRLQS